MVNFAFYISFLGTLGTIAVFIDIEGAPENLRGSLARLRRCSAGLRKCSAGLRKCSADLRDIFWALAQTCAGTRHT